MKKRGRALALLLVATLVLGSVPGTVMARRNQSQQTVQRKSSRFGQEQVEVKNSVFLV